MKRFFRSLILGLSVLGASSCTIQPPLVLPAQEVLVDMPLVLTDMELVWDINVDWTATWHYGWDATDEELFGKIEYPEPTSYEVRRYYLGSTPGVPHVEEHTDGFPVYGKSFTQKYEFGYYDMLIWSNIDQEEQVVLIDESDIDNVVATTTVTKGMNGLTKGPEPKVTAIFNQPEIFYSTYPQGIYISHEFEDYDYYDEEAGVWVKVINTELLPVVYIYLVQVILTNNEDGRVMGVNGNAALSAFANSTSVNTGHTSYDPCTVYFNTRMKKGIMYEGNEVAIIGGKLTTYGLCDMEQFTKTDAQYTGSRPDLPNYLYVDITYFNGAEETLKFDVTSQCQAQSHGGIITVVVDCHDLTVPDIGEGSSGSLFVPTVEDYDEVSYDIPM